MHADLEPPKESEFTKIMGGLALLTFLASPGLLIYQTYVWLKTGVWASLKLSDIGEGEIHHSSWRGVAEIEEWFVNLPLWVLCLVSGLILGNVLLTVGNEHHEKRWREYYAKIKAREKKDAEWLGG